MAGGMGGLRATVLVVVPIWPFLGNRRDVVRYVRWLGLTVVRA